MFNPFGSNQFIGYFFDHTRLATDHQHFQTIVVVQMNMKCGHDDLVMVMLNIRKRSLHMLLMVVIDQCHSPGDFLVSGVLPVFDKMRANHVGNRERTIVIAFLMGHLVELLG